MNKAELIVRLAESNDIESKAQAGRIVGQMLDVITETLGKGEGVDIAGLGKFSVTTREGTTTLTGEEIAYKTNNVKFKVSAPLKRAVQ